MSALLNPKLKIYVKYVLIEVNSIPRFLHTYSMASNEQTELKKKSDLVMQTKTKVHLACQHKPIAKAHKMLLSRLTAQMQ